MPNIIPCDSTDEWADVVHEEINLGSNYGYGYQLNDGSNGLQTQMVELE
jgi:hypothetical protein